MDSHRNVGDLAELVSQRGVLICCGAGGVGKTTTAAALALEGARRGRRACVVTIDPARRLADALGLAELSNVPRKVDGPWSGELWALMLDSKSTFDELVERYSDSPDQAKNILDNRLYRNLSGALSGTQEYMASEKLYELYEEHDFDLVVVDTPPTRNALDFLEAPGRLMRLLDNRIFRLLVVPTKAYLRAISLGVRTFLHTVSSVVGTEVVDDVIAFFRAFEGMEEGFRDRAKRVELLLADDATSFVLVTSARPESIDEAMWFAGKLADSGLGTEALVVNRAHPRFLPISVPIPSEDSLPESVSALASNLTQLEAIAHREQTTLAALAKKVGGGPLVSVPLLSDDVHDLAGLEAVADHLFGDPPTDSGG